MESRVMHSIEAAATAASLKSLSPLSPNEKPYTTGGTNPNTRNDMTAIKACRMKLSF